MSSFTSTSPSSTPVTTQYAAPTAGATVTINAGVRKVFIDPAGTLATLTVVLPASPVDGQECGISTSQILTALTITGTIVGTLTTLALGAFAEFTFSGTASKWFRTG
jgi:hypothetical protein